LNYQADKRASRQANIQAELSRAGVKLTYNTRCHHARRGYCSRWSEHTNAIIPCVMKSRSWC